MTPTRSIATLLLTCWRTRRTFLQVLVVHDCAPRPFPLSCVNGLQGSRWLKAVPRTGNSFTFPSFSANRCADRTAFFPLSLPGPQLSSSAADALLCPSPLPASARPPCSFSRHSPSSSLSCSVSLSLLSPSQPDRRSLFLLSLPFSSSSVLFSLFPKKTSRFRLRRVNHCPIHGGKCDPSAFRCTFYFLSVLCRHRPGRFRGCAVRGHWSLYRVPRAERLSILAVHNVRKASPLFSHRGRGLALHAVPFPCYPVPPSTR